MIYVSIWINIIQWIRYSDLQTPTSFIEQRAREMGRGNDFINKQKKLKIKNDSIIKCNTISKDEKILFMGKRDNNGSIF